MRLTSRKKVFLGLLLISILFVGWRFIRPMNIFVVDERFARPMHVEIPEGLRSLSAKECGLCHEDQFNEWSSSMHARAWTDPYYQVDYVFDGSQQICLNCHIPLEDQQENLVLGFTDKEMFKPILEPNSDFDRDLQSEGVTCAVCHVKNGVVVGPSESDRAPHPVQADPSLSSGIGACKKCHVVSGERWDTFYTIPPCGTVAEIGLGGQAPDCVGCHMPATVNERGKIWKRHFFRGGHHPATVASALKVEHMVKETGGKLKYSFILTNIGAAHYLPTGTPDRHLTLEFRLFDKGGTLIAEETHIMKRYILWRPFIVDLKDTRLPFGEPRQYVFEISMDERVRAAMLDVKVRYHLLDEKRRERIGYDNREPISYEIYRTRLSVSQ